MRLHVLRSGLLFVTACAGGNSAYSCGGYRAPVPGEFGPFAVLAPNGGEELTGGDTLTVEWRVGDSTTETVDIIVLAGGVEARTYEGVANEGTFEWKVPIDLPPSTDYAVRVVSIDGAGGELADDSDEAFTIRNWRMRRELTVTLGEDAGRGRALIELAAGDPILASGDGADLRFASSADRANGFDLPYWIETWSTDGARIWVRLPPAQDGAAHVFAFWDSPGVPAGSSMADAFPNRFETTGSGVAPSEPQDVDVFIVHQGHTLTVNQGVPLVVSACLIIVEGTIDASGAGYTPGTGPGGGFASAQAAGGGAAYGGQGGSGGYVYDEIPGEGGTPYGVMTDAFVDMGSGGGGSHSSAGAPGGGRVELHGTTVRVIGNIFADGLNGMTGTDTCGGGGGAGGGILLAGRIVEVHGTLSASGGYGGDGIPATAHHGGGGGGGGRIKLLYDENLDDGGTIRALGGVSGEGWAWGEPGAVGTIHRGELGATVSTITTGEPATLY